VKSIVVVTSADTLGRNQKYRLRKPTAKALLKPQTLKNQYIKGRNIKKLLLHNILAINQLKPPHLAIQIPVHTAMP